MEQIPNFDFGGFDVRPLSWPKSPEHLNLHRAAEKDFESSSTTPEPTPDVEKDIKLGAIPIINQRVSDEHSIIDTPKTQSTNPFRPGYRPSQRYPQRNHVSNSEQMWPSRPYQSETASEASESHIFDPPRDDWQDPLPTTMNPAEQLPSHDKEIEKENEDVRRALALSEQTAKEEEERRRLQERREQADVSVQMKASLLGRPRADHDGLNHSAREGRPDSAIQVLQTSNRHIYGGPPGTSPPAPHSVFDQVEDLNIGFTAIPQQASVNGRPDKLAHITSPREQSKHSSRAGVQDPVRQLSNTYRPSRSPTTATPTSMTSSPTDMTAERPTRLQIPDTRNERAPQRAGSRLEIRDTSRSRASRNIAKAPTGDCCDGCDTTCLQTSYCNVCRLIFCDPCWAQQVQHKKARQGKGAMLHEKTEHSVARKVQEVLTPDLTPVAREKLHERDIDTTWFGVARDESELPLFRDYGRYANLITVAKELRVDLPPLSSTSVEGGETLFPSLVSFVGETGAGKSTLIKLLIDLKMKEGDPNFPTPVVGAAGRDISTSEDVHLYLDPDSSLSPESRAPLLFADCEGLDGGERDPVGAILKKKHEKAAKAAKASTGHTGRRQPGLKHTSERELIWADTPRKKSREFAVAHLYPRLLYTFSDVIVFVLKNPR